MTWSCRHRAGPDEDTRDGFGRRTYEQLLTSWNARGGQFKDALNDTPKFVATSKGELLATYEPERSGR